MPVRRCLLFLALIIGLAVCTDSRAATEKAAPTNQEAALSPPPASDVPVTSPAAPASTAAEAGTLQGREATGHPRGYYAFQKARRPHDRPPRVRKPPYHRANVHCPERVVYGRFSPRDTLCGDLNKGFIPLNPMGQRPVGEPYPL